MSYLIASDYKRQIQDANLQQIISADNTILISAQLAAQAEVVSYLKQKYDVDAEIDSTTLWDKTKTYNAADRIYLDATAFNAA